MKALRVILTVGLATVLLAGCAAESIKKEDVKVVWPLPPDTPRIKYVRSISDAREVMPPKGFFKRVSAFLFGEDEQPKIVHPYGVFVEDGEKVLITDTDLQVVHQFDFSGKKYRQFFKLPGGRIRSPVGVAAGPGGEIFVSDSELGHIFQYRPDGSYVGAWGTRLTRPGGVAIDAHKAVLYAVDTGEHHVLAFNLKGEKLLEIGKRGVNDGEFNFPTHIAVSPVNGDVFVSDSLNFRIQEFTPGGSFVRQVGSAGSRLGNFSKLKGISVDSRGIIYAVDGLYDTVEMFNERGEFLMNFGKAGNHEGEFWLPAGISVFGDLIYVADSYNKRVQVFKLMDVSDQDGATK